MYLMMANLLSAKHANILQASAVCDTHAADALLFYFHTWRTEALVMGTLDFSVLFRHSDRFMEGFLNTIQVSVMALIGSFVLGLFWRSFESHRSNR